MNKVPLHKNSRIAIVGAGPAGIHMAVELKKKGIQNLSIFEKNDRIGGKTYSLVQKGVGHELGTTGFSISVSKLFMAPPDLPKGEEHFTG